MSTITGFPTHPTLRITGRTYASRNVLQAAGWRYDGPTQSWTLRVDPALVPALKTGDRATLQTLQTLRGNRPGCIVSLATPDGFFRPIWTSKECPQPTRNPSDPFSDERQAE